MYCSLVVNLLLGKFMLRFVFFGLVIMCLTGCMSGDMQAVSNTGKPVKFRYEQGMSSDTYFAEVAGESFKGTAVMVDASTTFGTAFGSSYSSFGSVFGSATGVGFSSGGKLRATMLGDKGSVLRCIMQYADTSGFTSMGGIGECAHSDGSKIDVVW